MRYEEIFGLKAHIKFVWAGSGAALLVAAITATTWHESGLDKVTEGVTPAQANAATSNTSPAVVYQSEESSATTALSDIKSLATRCQIAMIKDVCGIMTSSKPDGNERSTERLFIAGVGEVDAEVFNRLRDAGDKMCGEVETECVANWVGSGCKIAKAMYPV